MQVVGFDVDGHSQSATSSQDISYGGDDDFESHNDMSNYRTLYFNSEKENYALRGQVLGLEEANRKLKRQLIEMQKQIYAFSRNKRQSGPGTVLSKSQIPWSIPVVSCQQQKRREAPNVRVIREAADILPIEQNHSSISPTSLLTVSTKPMSGASKSVSMSVSSEEGNTSWSNTNTAKTK